MDTLIALTIFNGKEDARKFFSFYENVVNEEMPDKEKAEKIGVI